MMKIKINNQTSKHLFLKFVGQAAQGSKCKSHGDFGKGRSTSTSLISTNPSRNYCEKCFPVEKIPVFTLIRTDTTLDLSQEAEKV